MRTDESAAVTLSPVAAIALVIGAVVLMVALVFTGLCLASLFLPVILALVGVLLIFRGARGNQVLMVVGLVVIVIGVSVYLLG